MGTVQGDAVKKGDIKKKDERKRVSFTRPRPKTLQENHIARIQCVDQADRSMMLQYLILECSVANIRKNI
jgi:hypothetical protein